MTLWLVLYCVGFIGTGALCGWFNPDPTEDGARLAIPVVCTFWPAYWAAAISHSLGATLSEWWRS